MKRAAAKTKSETGDPSYVPQDTPRPQPAALRVDSGGAIRSKELEDYYICEPLSADECHPDAGVMDKPFWIDEIARKTTQIYSTCVWVVMPPTPGSKKVYDEEALAVSRSCSTAL